MNWTCPKCGRTLEVRRFPVRCCDVVDRGNGDISRVQIAPEVRAAIEAEANRVVHSPETCPYRKSDYRLELCPSCRGAIKIKVFKCDLYGECTTSKALPGIHVCEGR